MSTTPPGRPPVLLTRSYRDGTMAAIRSLGAHRVPLVVAFRRLQEPGIYSRYVRRRVPMRIGPPRGLAGLSQWLLAWGRANPGHVLIPADDSTAWLFALHQHELSRDFRSFLPPVDAMTAVLDKFRLAEACRRVGLDSPATAVASAGETTPAQHALLPAYVKRRSQVGAPGEWKGARAHSADDLPAALAAAPHARFDALVSKEAPELAGLIVQPDLGAPGRPVYTLSGFVDAAGRLLAARAQEKLLQRPVAGGVGVVFEDADVIPGLRDGIVALCRDTGYFGTFQVEFLREDSRYYLIDFNPRFQKAVLFDVARGMDLPAMVYAAATGDDRWLEELAASAAQPHSPDLAFCDTGDLEGLIRSGDVSPETAAYWRRWLRQHRSHVVDPGRVRHDPLPGYVSRASAFAGRAAAAVGHFRDRFTM